MSEIATSGTTASAPIGQSVGTVDNTGDSLVVTGGDSPATFEELEAFEAKAKSSKKESKSEVKEAVKETVKELSKSKKEDDDEKPQKEAKDKKPGEKEDKKLEAKDKPKEKKTLKAKLGDKELDLDPDVLIPVKINGKDEYMSLNELRSDRSGKVEWDKRFQQLDREKKEFQGKTNAITEKVKAIFQEQDPDLRFYRMAELSGVSPQEYRQKFFDDNIKLLENYYAMTDDEKKADAISFENKVLKAKLQAGESAQKQSQAIQQLDSKVQNLWKTHNVTQDQFVDRYDEIESLVQQGKFKGEVTPEFIVESITKDKIWDTTESTLNALGVELPIETRSRTLLNFVNDAYSLGIYDQAEIQEMVKEIWSKPSKEELVQEKVTQREEFMEGKKPAARSSKPTEVLLFDDL